VQWKCPTENKSAVSESANGIVHVMSAV